MGNPGQVLSRRGPYHIELHDKGTVKLYKHHIIRVLQECSLLGW